MIPAGFSYVRAGSVQEALDELSRHGGAARLLAGGHSLLPAMKLRRAEPGVLIDIGRLGELAYVRADGDRIAVGALTRHRTLERDPLVAEHVPLLAAAAARIGDQQVRNRGTIGGSLANADPAADLAAAVLALDGVLVARGPAGEREIPARKFFTGRCRSALAAGEMLTEIRLPAATDRSYAFEKFSRRALDWAVVGVAAQARPGGVAVALIGMGPTPVRATAVEEALAAGVPAAEAARLAARGCEPPDNAAASASYRAHLAEVLVGRALAAL
ncbi:FAD binding domain-containing protein [Streptosporangium sp. NPDC049644]|uniref:FAD binding domain-containing protein n=1 Tax=Streptosporangium sp. NPDC049644 TaxID=3155507 RepID=UPI003434AD80